MRVLACMFGVLGLLGPLPVIAAPAIAAPQLEHAGSTAPARAGGMRTADTERDRAWLLLGGAHPPPRQAIVAALGEARTRIDAPALVDGQRKETWIDASVAEVDGDRVRIIVVYAGLALLLWVDAEDLAPQLQRPTMLRREPTAAGNPPAGVELAAGHIVHVERVRGDQRRIRTNGELAGWIDADALASTFVAAPFDRTAPEIFVHGKAKIRDAPRGDVIFALDSRRDSRLRVHPTGPAKDGWLPVEYVPMCRPDLRVRGYVAVSDTPFVVHRGGHACVKMPTVRVGAPSDPRAHLLVRADTELVDDDGTLVGRVKTDRRFATDDRGAVLVPTRWGVVPLWIGATLGAPTPRPARG